MSLIQWVGFCGEVCLGRGYLFADSKSAGGEVHPGKQGLLAHVQVRRRLGTPFRADHLEMHILFLLEDPADSDTGTKYKI